MNRLGASAAALTIVALVAGCSNSPDVDGVLWRQVDAIKQPVFQAFHQTLEMDRTTLLEDIISTGGAFPGEYVIDSGDHAPLGPGVFLSRLAEGDRVASFSVLISSGPRNPAVDPLADDAPYGGPPAVYTCFDAEVEFAAGRAYGWSYDEEAECDAALVDALGDEAEFRPLYLFAG